MRVCYCGRALVGKFTSDQCPHCWAYLNVPSYRAAKDRETPVPAGPGAARALFNFAGALLAHVADGMAKRSREEIEAILTTHCQPCPLFSGTRCTHASCGCNVNGEEKFFNKLAWRSERCPIGKW